MRPFLIPGDSRASQTRLTDCWKFTLEDYLIAKPSFDLNSFLEFNFKALYLNEIRYKSCLNP